MNTKFNELNDLMVPYDELLTGLATQDKTIFEVNSINDMVVSIGETIIKGVKKIEFKYISDIIVKSETIYNTRYGKLCFRTLVDTLLINGKPVDNIKEEYQYVIIKFDLLNEITPKTNYKNIIKAINKNLIDIFLLNDEADVDISYHYKDIDLNYDKLKSEDAICTKTVIVNSSSQSEYKINFNF